MTYTEVTPAQIEQAQAELAELRELAVRQIYCGCEVVK